MRSSRAAEIMAEANRLLIDGEEWTTWGKILGIGFGGKNAVSLTIVRPQHHAPDARRRRVPLRQQYHRHTSARSW